MTKQKLLIIIDDLKRGGAELMLVGILPELNLNYDVILVTLKEACDFDETEIVCKKRFVLGFKGKISFIGCITKLKKIIKETNPSLIHAHLFYSSLAAKLACPKNVPLVSTIHSELSKNVFEHNKLYKFAEKITTKKRFYTIAVSKVVLDDYNKLAIGTQKQFVLRNYISDNYFQEVASNLSFEKHDKLRMIAVGNLKAAKNYEYLVQSILALNDKSVTLDIYGNTTYEFFTLLQKTVEDHSLPVQFKGSNKNLSKIFSNYDLYVMSSSNEGFGIAAIEAMAAGLPVLLSDIPVMREISCNNGLFFNLSDTLSLTNLIIEIKAGVHDLNNLSKKGKEIAKNYSKKNYLNALFGIYDDIMLIS